MLKKKITKWDLNRSHKEADMLSALKFAQERKSHGKQTEFVIRGRKIQIPEIIHYFKRKGWKDLALLQESTDNAVPSTHIECRTPQPVEENHTLPCMISMRGFSSQLDKLLRLARSYYHGICEQPAWRAKKTIFELISLESFYHQMLQGHILLQQQKVSQALNSLHLAFDLVKHLISQESFLLLPYLYHMMLPGMPFGTGEVLSKLFDYMSELIRDCHPHLDSIARSLKPIRGMTREERCQFSTRVLLSILEYLRVEFKNDLPTESELLSDVICTQSLLNISTNTDPAQDSDTLTSVSLWKLIHSSEGLGSLQSASLQDNLDLAPDSRLIASVCDHIMMEFPDNSLLTSKIENKTTSVSFSFRHNRVSIFYMHHSGSYRPLLRRHYNNPGFAPFHSVSAAVQPELPSFHDALVVTSSEDYDNVSVLDLLFIEGAGESTFEETYHGSQSIQRVT